MKTCLRLVWLLLVILTVVVIGCQQVVIGGNQLTAPTLATATGGNAQVSLSWTNAPGAVSYTVYFKKNSSTVTITANSGKVQTILTNSTTVTGLDNGYTYAFIVTAIGTGAEESDPSNTLTADTSGTAAAPLLSLAAGTYTGDQALTITSSTPGAQIAYTTDGSAPGRSSATYSTPVAVNASMTVKAIAYVPGWNPANSDSGVTQAAYKIIDLYLLGIDNGAPNKAVTWKNGVPTTLVVTGGDAQAKSMTVVGGNVYVGGYSFSVSAFASPCYWKNGVRKDLVPSPANHNYGYAIAVDGSGNVYVAGSDETGKACYWKDNGTTVTKTYFTTAGASAAYAIFLNGTDIYAAGYDYYLLTVSGTQRASYWINAGATTFIGQTDYASYAYGIAFDGTYVLTAGRQEGLAFTAAMYWQNATANSLPKSGGGLSDANAAYYESGAFYIAGQYSGAYTNASTWKVIPGATPTMTQNDLFKTNNGTIAKAVYFAGGDLYIRAYPKSQIDRNVIKAHAKCSMAR